MKKLVRFTFSALFLLLLAGTASAQSLCTVSGNAKNLVGASTGGGTITFSISNYSGPLYVTGTGLVVPGVVQGTVASDGSFSVALYGNDTLSPANTLYDVRIVVNGGAFEALYSITGATFLAPCLPSRAGIESCASIKTALGLRGSQTSKSGQLFPKSLSKERYAQNESSDDLRGFDVARCGFHDSSRVCAG